VFVELSEHRETVEDLRDQVDDNNVRIEPCRPLQSRRTVQAFGDNRVGALCFEESAESVGEKWMAAYQEQGRYATHTNIDMFRDIGSLVAGRRHVAVHDGVPDAAFPVVISSVGPCENDVFIVAQLPLPAVGDALLDPQPTGGGDNELLRSADLMSSHVLMRICSGKG
jgi:hypothetical protein